MIRNSVTLMPVPLRCSSVGSAAQARNCVTSAAICGIVASVPSVYATPPSYSGCGIAMKLPGK